MAKSGIKHLVSCRCILPTMKNKPDPPLHSFIVFSVVEDNKITKKLVTCNNCGIVHEVYEVCRSIIMESFEGENASLTKDDIAISLTEGVSNILSSYKKDLPDYEHVKFMVDENAVGDFIILSQEFNEGRKSGKILKYKGKGKFEIEPFSRSELI
tara:strand:+ start:353 stop:817 length:465 start_codon:yes stop_codon:yes gene_type:complete